MAIIEIKNLSKTYRVYQKNEGLLSSVKGLFHREYKEVHAVRDINFSVEEGEFVLSGVINPSEGEATVMGHVPWERDNEYRRKFALVMGQKNQLWWDLPAMESFRLNQHIYKVPKEKFDQTRDELCEMLDVQRLLKRPVRELSLGERMKMELIAALLHEPDVLFLDEPTIGLDVVAQHKIQTFLKAYQKERNNTIVLTSHYMKDIQALCNRVVIIANGAIYHDGSARSLDSLKGVPNVLEVEAPRIKFKVDRDDVGRVLSEILGSHRVDDVVVEDPPLEEVISNVFSEAQKAQAAESIVR